MVERDRLKVGERATVTGSVHDSVQLALGPHVVIAEVLETSDGPRYVPAYPGGEPGNFGDPMPRSRLTRGWI